MCFIIWISIRCSKESWGESLSFFIVSSVYTRCSVLFAFLNNGILNLRTLYTFNFNTLFDSVDSVTLHHHHHISIMELGHLLTRSGLTYPEASSKVCHNSFCQLENSVSLPWVIYYEAFYLHVVSSFSCTPVICPKLVLFLIPL